MAFQDLTGQRFGRLIVMEQAESDKVGRTKWRCLCDCGNLTFVNAYRLKKNRTKSCGCLRSEMAKAGCHLSHGLSNTTTWIVWSGMKNRCSNPNSRNFSNYGGRGIKVCDRWLESFENFLQDMGERPAGMSLDRIDNDGDYCRENCRWSTRTEQSNNTRRNRFVEFQGQTKTIAQWASHLEMPVSAIEQRLSRLKWSVERALTEPVKRRLKC